MRTSLNEIRLIDDQLLNQASTEDRLLLDAMLIIDPELTERVNWQKLTHNIIHQYGRRQLRAEIDTVHQKLFNLPEHRGFRQKILALFKGTK